MKKYNVQNYVRYKKEVEKKCKQLENKDWSECDRSELIVKFLPLVENLARKFSTSQQASGCMDLIYQVYHIPFLFHLMVHLYLKILSLKTTLPSFCLC